jgi:hypothetical protein
MVRLTTIILTKNAENLLADCIESIKFADEILVIDDTSTDRTVDLAKKLGAKIVQDTSTSFAEKRNTGLKHAKGEWILYIDSDERVSSGLAKEIQAALGKRDSTIAAYRLKRQNFYLGNHPWPKIERLERLFKKSQLSGWYGELHESAKVAGEIGELEGLLYHYTHRDLSSMLKKTIIWSETEAKLRFNAHHPQMTCWRFPRVIFTAFFDSYIKQSGWKIGTMGLVESIYQAFSMFVTYAKLWELQQKR